MKKCFLLIMCLVLVGGVSAFAQEAPGYEKMTPEETEAWLDTISYDGLLAYVADANYAQKAVPQITYPDVLYTLDPEGTLFAEYSDPVTIRADNFATYSVTLEDQEIANFVDMPMFNFWQGLGGGVVIGIVLSALSALIFG